MMNIIIISLLLIAKYSWCIPLDQFYPFGPDVYDQELKLSDPFSVFQVDISENFTFELTPRQTLFVSFNALHTSHTAT